MGKRLEVTLAAGPSNFRVSSSFLLIPANQPNGLITAA